MPVRSIDVLKSWFQTGDKPTEAQFADLIDSFRHAATPIAMTDVDGLATALNGLANRSELLPLLPIVGIYDPLLPPAGAIAIPDNSLVKALVLRGSTADIEVSVGTSPGDSDIGQVSLEAGAAEVVVVMRYFGSGGTLFIQSTQSFIYEIHR
jgi:hypothetical protein